MQGFSSLFRWFALISFLLSLFQGYGSLYYNLNQVDIVGIFFTLQKCRLSIIVREVCKALEAENISVDENLVDRCIDVGVGAVGTGSPIQLISVAYNLYMQQLSVFFPIFFLFLSAKNFIFYKL